MHCITGQIFKQIWPRFSGLRPKPDQKQPKIVLYAGMKTFEISKLENYKNKWNLAQICIIWTPLIHQNMRVSIYGRVVVVVGEGVSKKTPENVMELRESRLSYHLKPTQIMLKRRGFFTAIHLTNQPSNSSVEITWGREGESAPLL